MQNVAMVIAQIMQNVFMMSAVMLSVVMLSVVILCDIMLSVTRLSVIMLVVAAPEKALEKVEKVLKSYDEEGKKIILKQTLFEIFVEAITCKKCSEFLRK